MINDTFLTAEEVSALTKRTYRPAQVKVLNALGIDHKVHPDGDVLILRSHINKVFNGTSEPEAKMGDASPNWGAFNTCA